MATRSLVKETYQQHRYQQPVATFWWLRSRAYLLFALRELSCLFVAWFVVYLLMLVDAVYTGDDQYRRFVAWSGTSWMLAVNGIALIFLLAHTITWFNQAPQAVVLRWRGRRVARIWVVASIYLLWALLSGATILIFLAE
jgi:fumarate reductase subunit C